MTTNRAMSSGLAAFLLSCAPVSASTTTSTTTSALMSAASASAQGPPRLVLDDEASVRDALLARFDALTSEPAGLEAALDATAARFPEGGVLPSMLAVSGYAHLVRAGEIDSARARPAMAALVEQTMNRVARRIGSEPGQLDDYERQGTMLGELAFALGQWRTSAGDERWDEVHHHVVSLLVDGLREAPIASYPDQVWPVDSVVALLALRLHDVAFGQAERAAFINSALDALAAGDAGELPPSRVDTHTPLPPRGSDLSWRLVMLRDLDPERAQALYTRYVDAFWRGGLYSGFAEWGDGRNAPDADSGPIFDGVGATASTFGIATTLAFDDAQRRRRLLRQLPLGRRLVEDSHGARIAGFDIDATWVTGSLMGDATLFYAVTWRHLAGPLR